jgi:hypothetical protein
MSTFYAPLLSSHEGTPRAWALGSREGTPRARSPRSPRSAAARRALGLAALAAMVSAAALVATAGASAPRARRADLRAGVWTIEPAAEAEAEAEAAPAAEVWDTGRGHADEGGAADLAADPGAPPIAMDVPFPEPAVPYLDALAACDSLACLRDAASRARSAKQRPFPAALLIGWQKSATTSLYGHLARHPGALVSSSKEPEFFTAKCGSEPASCDPAEQVHINIISSQLGWHCRCCRFHPAVANYHSTAHPPANSPQAFYIRKTLRRDEFVAGGGRAVALEASTHYAMNGDRLAANVVEALPWVKVVASLREPISRAASMLVHMADREGRGCLAAEGADLADCLVTASQLVGHPGPFNGLDALHGNYSHPLSAWLEAVPPGQLLVLQYEELVEEESEAAVLKRVKDFLGLDPAQPKRNPGLDEHNIRKDRVAPEGHPMRRGQYEALVARVRPDAERVAALLAGAGLAPSAEAWMARWEAVWVANLAACGADGACMIQLS